MAWYAYGKLFYKYLRASYLSYEKPRMHDERRTKWLKTIDSYYKDFAWQEGYGAFSVSESNKEAVVQYIENQKNHHQVHTSQVEFCNFLKRHGYSEDDIKWWSGIAERKQT